MRAPARHLCPICGKDAPPRAAAAAADPPGERSAFPFCSATCKLVDLGRWLDGNYRIPGSPLSSTDEGEGEDRE